MRVIPTIFLCLGVVLAGLLGITLSVPLQAPAVILFGLAAIFTAIEVKKTNVENLRSKSSARLLWLAVIGIVYFVVRACWSPVWDLGIEDLMLILSAGLLYLVAGYGIAGKAGVQLRQGLAWMVILLLLLHLGSAVLQLKGGEGYSVARYLSGAALSSQLQVTGMYTYYGSFANFTVISGILCLSLGVWGRFNYGIRALIFLLGLVALCLAVWSQSRSAAVSMAPALIVFFVLVYISLANQGRVIKKRVKMALLCLGLLGLFGGAASGVWVLKNRVGDDVVGEDIIFGNNLRVNYWSMAGEQWADFPLLGAGSRSFSYECFKYWSPDLSSEWANPEFAHNEYLQLLADYGLVGLLSVLALVAGHLVVGVRRIRKLSGQVAEDGLRGGSNAMALAIAGVCGMTAMCVHVIFDFRTHLLANLLLLVCCAVWVLPVAKSTVWKSRSRGVRESNKDAKREEDRVRERGGVEVSLSLTGTVISAKGFNPGEKSRAGSWMLGIVMLVLGLGAISLGGLQLWSGLPLIQNKVAKEDGAWIPQGVNRDVWIPMLEESVRRSPNWRRYQRLGTLYRLEAASLEGNERRDAIEKAKAAYASSIEWHAHNPIPWINLASIYMEAGEFAKADEIFSEAAEIAKVRERWFKMHSLWANTHERWAISLWKQERLEEAGKHMEQAKKFYQLSYEYGRAYHYKEWVIEYTAFMMNYVRFLDSQNKFAASEALFNECRDLKHWYWRDATTGIDFYEAQHLYQRGYAVWLKRKPEEAYRMMIKAQNRLVKYRHWKQGVVDQHWHNQMKEIKKVIGFLEKTGIKK